VSLLRNWGGCREGSGRSKLPKHKRKQGYTFQLTDEEIKFIESFQGKNRSDCLRILISSYGDLKKQIDFSKSK